MKYTFQLITLIIFLITPSFSIKSTYLKPSYMTQSSLKKPPTIFLQSESTETTDEDKETESQSSTDQNNNSESSNESTDQTDEETKSEIVDSLNSESKKKVDESSIDYTPLSNSSSEISFKYVSKNDPYGTNDGEVQYFAEGVCSINNCDNCVSNELCQCPSGYAQNPRKDVQQGTKSCTYKRKKRYIFFTLELLLPFGAGHFYANRFLYGFLKLIYLALTICLDFILKNVVLKGKEFNSRKIFNNISYVMYFLYFCWQTADIICIGLNYFEDGYGILLMI